MKVLILGASGFLGGKIFNIIKSKTGFDVLGTCFQSGSNGDFIKLYVTIDKEIKSVMFEFRPDIVLWSLMSKRSEKFLIHMGLNNILKYIQPQQKLIFISTNAVFRGNCGMGNYNENEEPKYINSDESLDLYANAKIDGEKIVKKHNNSIIIRPGAIYGQDINGKWDKRISELISRQEQQQEVIRTKNLYNTFVKLDELATAIMELIKLDYKGIIHLGPQKSESYYDYFRKMSIKLNLNSDLIKSNVLSEDKDLSLNTSKSRRILGDIFSSV